MPYSLSFLFSLLISSSLHVSAALKHLSLDELEQRLEEIDTELSTLAALSLRSGAGSIGYRSKSHTSSANQEWVQVDFGKAAPIDEVVLVPCIWRTTESGFQSDGFPLEFRVIAGQAGESEGILVASFSEKDSLLPRIAPVLVPCSGITASWVRIEAVRLSPRGYDDLFIFHLAELLVFSGAENLALRRPVTASTKSPVMISPWGARYATDGFVPYGMDAAKGEKSRAYSSSVGISDTPSLTVDLGNIWTINQINLHAVDLSDTIPQSDFGDFGIPKHLRIEAANEPDFSDSVVLVDYKPGSHYEIGPILMWNIPETSCRYIRFTAIEPYIYNDGRNIGSRIAFAEVEIISEGKNVALGAEFTRNFRDITYPDRIASLTDGKNFYGDILPMKEWMHQLSRRHDLETERPIVETEISKRYTRQKINLNRLAWLAAILGAGICFIILIDRNVRLRHVSRIKERLAADLHDELGANIHSIGMLSDLAQDSESKTEWNSIHQRILALSIRTTTAIRYCTNMLEASGLYIGLLEDIERTAKRIGSNFEHEFTVEGEAWLENLKPRTQIDLFLFYKEALINICRHANATKVTTCLTANQKEILFTISDDGSGIPASTEKLVPPSLKRRAHLMGAQVRVDASPEGGTRISLHLLRRKFGVPLLLRRPKYLVSN